MSLALYMDVQMKRAITDGLRRRGADVLTAQEDATDTLPDNELLDRATTLARVLVSEDVDFLVETDRRQHAGEHFAGLVHVSQDRLPIGKIIDDLELIAKVYEPVDMVDRVEFLPL